MADPLVEALARTILRHQLGCNQPAEPPAWITAAATEIAGVIFDYTSEGGYSAVAYDITEALR